MGKLPDYITPDDTLVDIFNLDEDDEILKHSYNFPFVTKQAIHFQFHQNILYLNISYFQEEYINIPIEYHDLYPLRISKFEPTEHTNYRFHETLDIFQDYYCI